ncbi:MAG TPA: acyl-CoA dehydrogenase [Planctomycetales bacterium]|jgi:alkylation response protein AidB-like acyl-CoA dehydrogenase|nr:acyl-CoA dehydrogenase [Planctomycetales bacterium]
MDAATHREWIDQTTLQALAAHADRADADTDFPMASWELVRGAGVPAWSVPIEFGGLGLSASERLHGYEQLAGACLTTTFLLSQRDAAVRRVLSHGQPAVCAAFLPRLARDELFLTVGLSQLTTSRQHQAPSLAAAPRDGGYVLEGVIPWVTGAARADAVLVGATLDDGLQVLMLMPRDRAGVEIDAPMDLCALRGSQTTQIHCRGVRIEREDVLAGPAPRVLGAAAGGLDTSCLALGLAGAAIDHLHGEASVRPDLRPVAERFESARQSYRRQMYSLADGQVEPADATDLRIRANELALHSTQAALTVSKGAGFVRPHPAQRWARQALFFLVWSCPRPAAEGMLAHLLPDGDGEPACG